MEENGGREGGGKGKGKLLVLLLPHTISCIEYRSIALTQRLGFELKLLGEGSVRGSC